MLIYTKLLNTAFTYLLLYLGGKKCTTLLMERGLGGEEECGIPSPTYGTTQNETTTVPKSAWWSCTEWCLSKVWFLGQNLQSSI